MAFLALFWPKLAHFKYLYSYLDIFSNYFFSCVEEANCESYPDLGIRDYEDEEAIADESYCPNPPNEIITNDPRDTNRDGEITLPITGYKCCSKDRIINSIGPKNA